MKLNYPYLLYVLHFIQSLLCVSQIYVAPQTTCGSTCTGSSVDPFENLFVAFQKGTEQHSTQIIILSDPLTTDFYAVNETSVASSTSENEIITEYVFTNLQIKPLYCNDELVFSNPTLLDKCFALSTRPKIYLKTTRFRLVILESIHIKDVIIDGIEDIEHANSISSNLMNCISNKIKCCEPNQIYSSTYPDLLCFNDSSASILTRKKNHSLIIFGSENNSIENMSLILENVELKNFISPHLESLIQTGPYASLRIIFNHSSIDKVYFNTGLISYGTDENKGILPKQTSSLILFENVSFTNYNVWDIQSHNTSRREGYLFYAQDTFSGVLLLKGSHFSNFTSSIRNKCWPQTKQYYKLPMSNFLSSEPRSRSDLWNQYHQEMNNSLNKGSSLISIVKLNGSIGITECTFKNIIGTSGSVLRVDDIVPTIENQLNIENSTFDGNFAYDNYANIMLVKKSDPYFSYMLDCPRIKIDSSTFKNSYGCPGSYGNILLLCYWENQPQKSGLTNYSLSSKEGELIDAWEQRSEEQAYISVQGSVFENNLLAVSNSLSIIGGYFALVKDNIFQNNGGTTAEIAKISLESSYFMERYPTSVTFSSPTTHFGQSTAVYIDRIIKVYCKGNTFQKNWGPWEGSMSLASSVTVKNVILTLNGILFENNHFENHSGIPSEIATLLNDSALKSNAFMDPLITISVDVTGSDQIASILGLDKPINILFEKNYFNNNTLNYDYKAYDYNSEELKELFIDTIPHNAHFQSGMVKLLWNSEAIDDFSYGFKIDIATLNKTALAFQGGEVISNELLSKGCFFTTVSFFTHFRIFNNRIYTRKPDTEDIVDPYIYYFFPDGTPTYGILCQSTNEFIGPTSLLQIESLIVKNNTGLILNLFAKLRSTCVLMNSIFDNNTATSFGMISILIDAKFTYINNIFTNNDNFAGNICIEEADSPVGLYNVHLNNTGSYASVVTAEIANFAFEGLSKVYWNKLKTFEDYEETLIPVFGVYTINYITYTIFCSDFKGNVAYSGVLNAMSSINLHNCKFTDHHILGISVLGVFPSLATIVMEDILLINNTIIKDSRIPKSQSGLIVAHTSTLKARNITIIGGSSQNGAMLIFANSVNGSIESLTVRDFHRNETGQSPLINLEFSTISLMDISFSNVTGLFKFTGSSLMMTAAVINNVVTSYENQFLFDLSNTNLTILDFEYLGNGKHNKFLPLIGGDRNNIKITMALFENATGGENKIFDLKNSENFLILDSTFKYSEGSVNVTIFDLASSNNVIIQNCFFILPGKVIHASEIQNAISFVGNTLLTTSHVENIVLENIGICNILENTFVKQEFGGSSFPTSQISILDSRITTLIYENRFVSLYGFNGIVEIRAENYPYKTNLTNNIFIGNTGSKGGSINLNAQKHWSESINPEALIQNSSFIGNSATDRGENRGKGGALYLTSVDRTNQTTILTNCKFFGNTASTLGGAIFFDFSPPIVNSDSKFVGNFAEVPNHIGSYPVKLALLDDQSKLITDYIPGTKVTQIYQSQQVLKLDNIMSGGLNERVYKFALIDMFDQLAYSDNTSAIEIYPVGLEESLRSQFSNKLSLQAAKGLYTLDNFKFTYKINQKLNVTFRSTAVPNFNSLPTPDLILLPDIIVEVNFRTCQAGEFIAFRGNFIFCVQCGAGYWQVNPFVVASYCEPCDTESTICEGGNRIIIKPGHWRMNETADIVSDCPRPESCLATDDGSPKCAENYIGNLCSNCVEGWAKNNEEECIDCKESVSAYLAIIGMFAFKLVLIGVGVRETLYLEKELASRQRGDPSTAALIRIFISYSQIFALILSIETNWPSILTRLFKVAGFIGAASDKLFTLNCIFLIVKRISGVDIVFADTLFNVLTPCIFTFFSLSFWLIYVKIRGQSFRNNQELKDNLITTIVIICFDMQPDVIKSTFSLLQCVNLYRKDKPMYFLVNAYDIKCWESPHLDWVLALVIPTLLLWVVFLPSLIFYILRKNRENLDSIKIAKKYSFIYDGYRKEKYYWEIIIIIRKFILVSNAVFSAQNSVSLEIIFFLVIIILSSALNAIHKPYASPELNNLEKISNISLGTLNLCGLYFAIIENNTFLDTVIIIVGVFGNLYFLVTFGKNLLKKLQEIPWLMKIIETMNKKLCCWLRFALVKKVLNRLELYYKRPRRQSEFIQPGELILGDASSILEDNDAAANRSRDMNNTHDIKIESVVSNI